MTSRRLGVWIRQQVHPRYLDPVLRDFVDPPDRQLAVLEALSRVDSPTYRILILRHLIRIIEASPHRPELHEQLIEEYANLLANNISTEPATLGIVRYQFGLNDTAAVREDPTVIARDGCTGHRTWEAAIALADYLVHWSSSQHESPKMNWVELGAGTGLAGLIAAQLPQTDRVLLTDGSDEVTAGLAENIVLNNATNASTQVLWWGRDKVQPLVSGQPQIVIAADVTYDDRLFAALVGCIAQFLELTETHRVIVSATVRSQATQALFEDECHSHNLVLTTLKTYLQPFDSDWYFIAPESGDIVILEVAKGSQQRSEQESKGESTA